jgi:hypothetical protein
MKNALVVLVVCSVLTGIGFGDLNDGLVAHWTFDEGSGDIAYDSAGTNDGMLINGPIWTLGQIGDAIEFNGATAHVSVPDDESLRFNQYDSFTITLWAMPLAGCAISDLVCKMRTGGSGVFGYEVKWAPSQFRFVTESSQIDYIVIRTPTDSAPPGSWYHVAATYSNNDMKIYLNGELSGTGTFTSDAGNTTPDKNLEIGVRSYDSTLEQYFKGRIDDVRIYDRALSAEEVEQLYITSLPKVVALDINGPNEVAEESSAQYTATAVYSDSNTKDVTNSVYWEVTPNDYADINDSGLLTADELVMPTEDVTVYAQYEEGNNTFGAEKNVQIFALCPQGYALEFDGQDDFLFVPDSDSISVGNKDHTLCAWIKPDSIARSGGNVSVIFAKIKNGSDKEYDLKIDLGGYLHTDEEKNGNNQFAKTTTAPVTLNVWQHIAVSFNAESKEVAFYYNGILQPCSSTITALPDKFDDDLYLGKSGGIYTDGHFDGLMDDLAIYNRVLSQDDIRAVMKSGPAADDRSLAAYWNFDEGPGPVVHDLSGNGNDAYLGSDPCEPDSADPCWVEPGAPRRCTSRQMIVRNIEGALERKEMAQQQMAEASLREDAAAKLLLQQNTGGRNVRWLWSQIHNAIQIERLCSDKLQESVTALDQVLDWLVGAQTPPSASQAKPDTKP